MNNAIKYVKLLESTGVPREQAETHVQMIADILEGELVTKQDIKELEYKLTIKLGTIVTVAIAAATAIMASIAKFL